MKYQILDNGKIEFYNTVGNSTAIISLSGSDLIIKPTSASNDGNLILGNPNATTSDVEFGTAAVPVTLKLMGGGTLTANGNTLNIGTTSPADTVNLYNVTFSQSLYLTGSIDITGSATANNFIGGGSGLTNLQRPITSSAVNFTASNSNAGYYFRVGGGISCSIQSSSLVTVATGTEYEFFQTSSAGNMLFHTGSSTITLNSKNDNLNLAGQFSSAVLKKVGTDEWDLIGDLT